MLQWNFVRKIMAVIWKKNVEIVKLFLLKTATWTDMYNEFNMQAENKKKTWNYNQNCENWRTNAAESERTFECRRALMVNGKIVCMFCTAVTVTEMLNEAGKLLKVFAEGKWLEIYCNCSMNPLSLRLFCFLFFNFHMERTKNSYKNKLQLHIFAAKMNNSMLCK